MNYTPKTEAQLTEEALLPEGIYDFEVIDTKDTPSKKGNDMITLKLAVFDGEGRERHLFDYIAFGSSFGERKFRRAAAACGLLEIYSAGNLIDRTFMGACGQVLIKRQDGTDDYPMPKNVISEYIPKDEGATDTRPTHKIIGDGLPF